jgi:hypothetical protein
MSDNVLGTLLARSASLIPSRLRASYHVRKTDRLEREHLREFQEFYSRLPDKRDIFYLFFTSDLLHWVTRTLSFVPDHVNVVLLGSNLSEEESAWIRANLRRPFHPIRLWTDDKTVWEFLFQTNEHHFGWLDIDCFALEPGLFREMAAIGPGEVSNCIWSLTAPGGTELPCSYFLFLNADIIRTVQEQVPLSPTTYSYDVRKRPGRPYPYAYSRLVAPHHRRLLEKVLPPGKKGRPVYASESRFYDTLQLYHLVATALGFRLHKVRPLTAAQQLASPEVVHVGKVSYYQRYQKLDVPELQRIYTLLSQIDYALLSEMGSRLPAQYEVLRGKIGADLQRLGAATDVETIQALVCAGMARVGAHPSVMARILGMTSPPESLASGGGTGP